jgi:hypothetical protein
MADYKGRYFSPRDFNLVHSFNSELLNDIVQTLVKIYKIAAEDTDTNIYGEANDSVGKMFYPGVDAECLIEFNDSTVNYEGFGPDKQKVVRFKFNERFMQQINLYPEIGDIIYWDDLYFEISNVIQEQYVGGQADKQLSIICETNLSRMSGLSITQRNR